MACVHAAVTLGSPATIVVPLSTSAYMIDKLRAAGASDVIQFGESWIDADEHLRSEVMASARQQGQDPVYVPPFDDPVIWEGHASLVEELREQMPEGEAPDAIICSVGGGGLFCGIMQGLHRHEWESATQVLAVETQGAHSLNFSLQHGVLSTLPCITSKATTLGARTVAPKAFAYAQSPNVTSLVLSDLDAMQGSVQFAEDERIMVELACGVSLALCYDGRLKRALPQLTPQSKVVVVVCGGANVSVDMLSEWREQILNKEMTKEKEKEKA